MSSDTSVCQLFSLPPEVRCLIYSHLLDPATPPSTLRITSLFIRAYYRSIFMTQQSLHMTTPLLRVCKQITAEALPILYALPLWRASCRLEALASQIGMENFSRIKRMEVDVDDLPGLVESLRRDAMEADELEGQHCTTVEEEVVTAHENAVISSTKRLHFGKLEELRVEGYQTMALTSRATQKSRLEALKLFELSQQVLQYHPCLNIMVQQERVGNGGSDAVDFTMGRVRWRFVRHKGCMINEEYVVDLGHMMELMGQLVDLGSEDDLVRRRSSFASWTNDGVYQQYPYLGAPLAVG